MTTIKNKIQKSPSKFVFSSDTHYGHGNIIKFCNRPFDSVRSMDEGLIYSHNKIVEPDDIWWFTGDFSFYRERKQIADILCRLNGKKRFILGNHDEILGDNKKYFEDIPGQDLQIFPFGSYIQILPDPNSPFAVLCHFPFDNWNKSHFGTYHLHGHVHSKNPLIPGKRRMDIGVDGNDYAPVLWTTVHSNLQKVPVNAKKRDN